MNFTGAGSSDMAAVYRSNSVCNKTPHCGTPFLNWRCVDVLLQNIE